MKVTFIPGPGSSCRVISADDPQPEESGSSQARNKRIAPPAAPTTQADAPPAAVEHAPSVLPGALPGPSATKTPSVSSPACLDEPDFLKPLPPGSCTHCPDRPLLFQARQQPHYYRP